MINRTMVRTHMVQTLFAHYEKGGDTHLHAKNVLLKSFDSTYSLYCMLLDFVNELTMYAEEVMQEEVKHAKATHRDYVPNRRFVDNRLAKQLFDNRRLRERMESEHLGWDTGLVLVKTIYNELVKSAFYNDYMAQESVSYEDDNRLWRKIFDTLLAHCEQAEEVLDEMEVRLDQTHWTTDYEVVLSYVVKTLKRFTEDSDASEPLLEMFDSEEECTFATQLLDYALDGREEYEQMIYKHLRNWDAERLANMDVVIMQTALAEILHFPNIAVQVSLNEYIEIAKEFSGEKSYIFINGLLDEILNEQAAQGNLPKLLTKHK